LGRLCSEVGDLLDALEDDRIRPLRFVQDSVDLDPALDARQVERRLPTGPVPQLLRVHDAGSRERQRGDQCRQ
jgi:hypothetical protein